MSARLLDAVLRARQARLAEPLQQPQGWFLVVHPDKAAEMKRVDAREQWYRQHSENRRAKREGRAPRDIERICGPGELGQVLGFTIIECEEVVPLSKIDDMAAATKAAGMQPVRTG